MRRKKENHGGSKTSFFLLLLMLLAITPKATHAQCTSEIEAFQAGEAINYELYFNWKFIWVKAGTASLKTIALKHKDQDCFKTSLLAISSKRADHFFKMRDTLVSIYSQKMQPLYFRKGAEEGDAYRLDEVWYKYANNKVHLSQKYINKKGEITLQEKTEQQCIYDMISLLAKARSLDPKNFKVGERLIYPMATGSAIEDQILIYRGKKKVKSENGTEYNTLLFSLMEKKKGAEREIISFYISDDKNHIPIRLDLNLNFGSAKAYLKVVHGNKYPLTSVVKK